MSLTGENGGEKRITGEKKERESERTGGEWRSRGAAAAAAGVVEFVCVGVRLLLCVELIRAL